MAYSSYLVVLLDGVFGVMLPKFVLLMSELYFFSFFFFFVKPDGYIKADYYYRAESQNDAER